MENHKTPAAPEYRTYFIVQRVGECLGIISPGEEHSGEFAVGEVDPTLDSDEVRHITWDMDTGDTEISAPLPW